MKKIILLLTLCGLPLTLAAQPADDKPAPSGPLNQQERQYKELSKKYLRLEMELDRLYQAKGLNEHINSSIANWVTFLSIFLTIISVAIPLINWFAVIRPNRRLAARLKHLESDIPQRIERDFDTFLRNHDRRNLDRILEHLSHPARLHGAANELLMSDRSLLTENDYEKIIAALNGPTEIRDMEFLILTGTLRDHGSNNCRLFFRNALETGNPRLRNAAIEYLCNEDFMEHFPYIETVIAGSEEPMNLLRRCLEFIEEKYVGNPLDPTTSADQTAGIEKIKMLLNSGRIVSVFNKENFDGSHSHIGNWMLNNMRPQWYDFYRDTLVYQMFYEDP